MTSQASEMLVLMILDSFLVAIFNQPKKKYVLINLCKFLGEHLCRSFCVIKVVIFNLFICQKMSPPGNIFLDLFKLTVFQGISKRLFLKGYC